MKKSLVKNEWKIMETLWEQSPLFLSQIMEEMKGDVDWQKSTFSTYIRKLFEEGYVDFKTISGNRAYFPVVSKQECAAGESRFVIDKLSDSSAKLFLSCMIRESGLDEADISELKELISDLSKKQNEEGK